MLTRGWGAHCRHLLTLLGFNAHLQMENRVKGRRFLNHLKSFVSNTWSFQIMEGQRFCGSEDVDPIMLGELEENRAEVIFTTFKHFSMWCSLVGWASCPVLDRAIVKSVERWNIEHWREGGGIEELPSDPFLPWTPSERPSRDGKILDHVFTQLLD